MLPSEAKATLLNQPAETSTVRAVYDQPSWSSAGAAVGEADGDAVAAGDVGDAMALGDALGPGTETDADGRVVGSGEGLQPPAMSTTAITETNGRRMWANTR